MHRLLRERGALEGACVERSYLRILDRAASRNAPGAGDETDSADGGLAQLNGL